MLRHAENGSITEKPGVLEKVGRHGDRLVDFLWQNRKLLLKDEWLVAVLKDGEAYLDGTRTLPLPGETPTAAPASGSWQPVRLAPGEEDELRDISRASIYAAGGLGIAAGLVGLGMIWLKRTVRIRRGNHPPMVKENESSDPPGGGPVRPDS
jgi:hypothetical protein